MPISASAPAFRRTVHRIQHDPERWEEFRRRYLAELRSHREAVNELRDKERGGKVTLIYATHDVEHSGALVLKQFLARKRSQPGRSQSGSRRR